MRVSDFQRVLQMEYGGLHFGPARALVHKFFSHMLVEQLRLLSYSSEYLLCHVRNLQVSRPDVQEGQQRYLREIPSGGIIFVYF